MSENQDFITCCPACHTSFRVTQELMEIASGAVRCGACLRVFQAIGQIVEEQEEIEAVSTFSEPSEPSDSDEIESWYWSEWDLYVDEAFSQLHVPREVAPAEQVQIYDPGTGAIDQDVADSVEESSHEVPEATQDAEHHELQTLVSKLDLQVDPESLVAGHVSPGIHPVWYAAVLVLVLSGFLQFVWFNHDIYSQKAEYRPWYLGACSLFGCELAEYTNLSDLTTSNLIVRSHPDASGALIVDAIVRNSSNYRQRFPFLLLQFRDIENRPVAQRQFAPADYLAGELRGSRFIPRDTEVRFSLEIADPGNMALGYTLEVIQNLP
ncbi:MAG: hypothetical protein CMQ19_02960 [Gammaproteobacteria bacterium]|nr:hypothetical protein [Gammaproteobacteria bacterium]|tara:strand:- start:2013 stop:2981 length:969 start_codon:yes stop_codon:yes gene_type:complete